MMKVLILYGGRSGEHEVSLVSATSVVRHLKDSYSIKLIGIDKEGLFYLQPDDLVSLVRGGSEGLSISKSSETLVSVVPGRGFFIGGTPIEADIVFPVLHGSFGEDGTIQGFLDTVWIPYVGAGVLGSSLGMDKEKTKQVWKEGGLPIVPYLALEKTDMPKNPAELKRLTAKAEETLGYPLFVKPASAGSSVGISKVKSSGELQAALETAFLYDSKVLIEKGIRAREIECSVLGNENPRVFTPGEVVPSHDFYDYEAKYTDPAGAKLLIPADMRNEDITRVKNLALCAYRLACVEGMARVDFFLDADDGALYLNEINTIPGFTGISMFPRMCAHDGLSYPELLDSLIDLGLKRHERREALTYSYQ